MKFAAFISIIVSVAVLFGACAGAVGPKGEKGDTGAPGATGETGQTGETGAPGAPGTAAFQGLEAMVLFNDEELMSDGVALAADGTSDALTINMASYFIGGAEPYTYELAGDGEFHDNNAAAAVAEEVTEEAVDMSSGQLSFKLTAPASGVDTNLFAAESYTEGYRIMVKAMDANSVPATAMVVIGLNRAPQLKGTDANTDTVVDESVTTPLLLGSQAADRGTALTAVTGVHAECAKINECMLDVFQDDDKLTVTVTGMTVGGKADSMKVTAVASDKGVTLSGMRSTYDTATSAHIPVRVNLMARDTKGLETKAAVMVSVDTAPSLSDLGKSIMGATYNVDNTYTLKTNGAVAFFMDDLGADVTVAAAPTNAAVATIPTDVSSVPVTVTGVTAGQSTTIKLTATEPGALGQTAELEFTVNVTKVGS